MDDQKETFILYAEEIKYAAESGTPTQSKERKKFERPVGLTQRTENDIDLALNKENRGNRLSEMSSGFHRNNKSKNKLEMEHPLHYKAGK